LGAAFKHINVAVLFVSDMGRAKTFYQDTLGLPLNFGDERSAGFDLDPVMLILLDREGAVDLLSEDAVAALRPVGVTSQLVTFVEDVDAVYSELIGRGVEFVREPVDRAWGMRTAHFKDPDGNIWEIAQRHAAQPS